MEGFATKTSGVSSFAEDTSIETIIANRFHAIAAEVLRKPMEEGRFATSFLDQIPFAFFVMDKHGYFILANRKAMGMCGVSGTDAFYGKRAEHFFSDDNLVKIRDMKRTVLDGIQPVVEVEMEKPAASLIPGWMMLVCSPLHADDGSIAGVIFFARDITIRKRTEFLRKGHAVLLEQIARGNPLNDILHGLVHLVEAQLTDVRASILFYEESSRVLRQGAAPNLPEEYSAAIDGVVIGQNVGSCGTAAWLRAPVMVADTWTDPRWADYAGLARRYDLRSCWSTPIIDASGTLYGTFALYSANVREPSEAELEITAMATDLAAIAIGRARSEEHIRHLANRDALTGLPNRRHFLECFSQAIDDAGQSGDHLVIAFFDLDNFKQINDTMGHGAGDDVLREVAKRLAHHVRETDLVVRLGGDEFAIVMACKPGNETLLSGRLNELHEAICQPVRTGMRSVTCGGSMGVAVFPRDGATPDALLARADARMYSAKKRAQG